MYALMMLFVLGCAAAAGMFSLSIVAKLFPALEHGTPLPGAIHMAFAVVGLALVLYSKSKEITAAGQPLAGELRDWGLGVLGYLTIAVVVLNGTGARVNGAVGGLGARPFVALFACAIALGAHLINARKMLQVRQKAALDVPMSAAAVAPVVAPVAPKVIATKPTKAFADIGGMKDLKATLARALAPYRAYNGRDAEICDQNGLLLSGPPGNGKTMIAEAIAGELGFNFINATVGDVTSKWVNQSSEELEAVVNAAIAAQPCVLFFDEFDAIARSRDGASARSAHAEDLKLVNSLLTQIDRIRKHRVLLIAATNFPDAIDPAIVRDGRFDHRIEVPYPDFAARLAILNDVAKRYQVNVPEAVANQASRRWEQRSAAFIDGVLKRVRDDLRATGKRTADLVDLKAADRAASRFESALPTKGDKLTQMHLPEATMMEAKSLLGRLRHWDETIEQGGTPPRGVLLYGPPGTGKTNLIRAVARELGDWHLFVVNAAEILADPRSFKDVLHKASQHRPAFVFIDEADELLKNRTYSGNVAATNEILTAMDGMASTVPEVVFVAATNSAEAIDAAAKRGGRFDEKIYMGPFAGSDLVELIEREFARRPTFMKAPGVTAEGIAESIGEAAPADVVAILNKAINYTFIDGSRRAMTMEDVHRAAKQLTAV